MVRRTSATNASEAFLNSKGEGAWLLRGTEDIDRDGEKRGSVAALCKAGSARFLPRQAGLDSATRCCRRFMTARAIWKGHLVLGKQEVPVKVYSAVQDQAVHFHLLHDQDLTPAEQRIVRKDNGRAVAKESRARRPADTERRILARELGSSSRLRPRDPPAALRARATRSGQWFDPRMPRPTTGRALIAGEPWRPDRWIAAGDARQR